MPLFSVLRLLHGAIVHKKPQFINLLVQNKYYVVPIVNVDGVVAIEKEYLRTGELKMIRKN